MSKRITNRSYLYQRKIPWIEAKTAPVKTFMHFNAEKKLELKVSFGTICSELTGHLSMCGNEFLNYKYHDLEKGQLMMSIISYAFVIKYNFEEDNFMKKIKILRPHWK